MGLRFPRREDSGPITHSPRRVCARLLTVLCTITFCAKSFIRTISFSPHDPPRGGEALRPFYRWVNSIRLATVSHLSRITKLLSTQRESEPKSAWPRSPHSAPYVRGSKLSWIPESTRGHVRNPISGLPLLGHDSAGWAGAWDSLVFISSLQGTGPADW